MTTRIAELLVMGIHSSVSRVYITGNVLYQYKNLRMLKFLSFLLKTQICKHQYHREEALYGAKLNRCLVK